MLLESFRLFGLVIDPSALLCLLVLATFIAMLLRRNRLAFMLQSGATGIIIFFALLPGGAWLALPLERRFPIIQDLPEDVTGIITLGGTERLAQSAAWGQPSLSDPTPIAMLLALGRRYPHAKLIFTGGSSLPGAEALTESGIVRDFLRDVGADASRVMYEERSRNTLENALFTREMIHPRAGERWILVGQATSLPRAVGVFRHAGWNVIPVPAGFLTDGAARISSPLHIASRLSLASLAIHEWGGLLVYRLMGYTDELFPGPQ